MLVFSSGNLDMLNVTCYAWAHNAFGLQAVERETPSSLLPLNDDDANQNDNPSYNTTTNGNVQVNHVGLDILAVATRTSGSLCINHKHGATRYQSTSYHIGQLPKTSTRRIGRLCCLSFDWLYYIFKARLCQCGSASGRRYCCIDSRNWIWRADAIAAIPVTVIILASLIPLLHGLFEISCEIYEHWTRKPS
jgi:hypothetical protein